MGLRKRSESTRLKKINVADPGNNVARTMNCECSGNCTCERTWMDKDTYMNSQQFVWAMATR